MSLSKSEVSDILNTMSNILTRLIDRVENDTEFDPQERREILNTMYEKICGIQLSELLDETNKKHKLQIKRGDKSSNDQYTGLSGEITMDTDTKTLRIHDGETVGGITMARASDTVGDWVIESQFPSAENNYTWYRKYKSGWVEQGGISANEKQPVIVLPIPMQNINYTVSLSCPGFGASNYDPCISNIRYGTLTETGFTIQNKNHSGQSYAQITHWQVSGIAAQ